MSALDEILDRVEQGTTASADAGVLRFLVREMQQDIANLTATLEDALVFECGVIFQEEDSHEQSTCAGLPIGIVGA